MNSGRQREFDAVKALFMLAIFAIHAFQVCGSASASGTNIYRIIYITGVMSGAPIYTFVMGLGMNYSKRGARQIAFSGIKLIGFQYLNNLAYAGAILLGTWISTLYFAPDMATMWGYTKLNLMYINIFFMAGAIYLFLALLKKLQLQPAWYLALGAAFAVISPLIARKQTGIAWLDIVLSPLVGGKPYTSFAVLPYVSYGLIGVYFGNKLRNTNDKDRFYKRIVPPCALVMAGYLVYAVMSNPSMESLFKFFSAGYIYPDIFRVCNNVSTIIVLAGVMYFMRNIIEGQKKLNEVITFVSTHISKYYAIHATVYMLFLGLLALERVDFGFCVVLCILCIFITEVIVRWYVSFMKKRAAVKNK